jgi:N-methylhydantoinase A
MQAFEKSYVAAFTRTPPTTQVEIINVRVSASIDVEAGALPVQTAAPAAGGAIKATRPVYFPEFRDFHTTTVYDRYALVPGQTFGGPAIVEERESTLVVGPGGRFEVADSGNIVVGIG